jgi:hypothetical protein
VTTTPAPRPDRRRTTLTAPLAGALLLGGAVALLPAPAQAAPSAGPGSGAATTSAGPAPSRQAHTGRIAGAGQVAGLAAAAATAVTPPPDGTFVRYEGRVFRMVGGATLYVMSWANFGGAKPVVTLTKAQWLATNQYPADGTFVQNSVTHAVYRFVAGAPIYVTTFKAFKTRPKVILEIDPAVLARAGGQFPFDSVSDVPLDWDGTNGGDPVFVVGGQTGHAYKLTGGAPIHVSTWAAFGGAHPYTVIDQNTINAAGGTGHYRYLRKYPMDGWTVTAVPGSDIYVFAGGAPIAVGTLSLLEGLRPARTDAGSIARDGHTEMPYGNIRHRPADGTFLRTVQGGRVYRVQDGNPVYVSSWSQYGGIQPYVDIDELAIQHAGESGVWNHLGPVQT